MVEIGQFLSSEPLLQDPRNHCVHILEVLQDPFDSKKSIMVMPFLKMFDAPGFLTTGESVAFLKQAIEGLHFMHDHHVAHRDISNMNVMMDATPMYTKKLWHPLVPSFTRDFSGLSSHCSRRAERAPRYFYIDFGLSRKYNPADGPPQELPVFGGDRTVPEFQDDGYDVPADPFRTDIYYLGNLMRTTFLKAYRGLEIMEQLVADMVQSDPQKRRTITEVETRFIELSRKLSWWKLRARLVYKDKTAFERAMLSMVHFFRTAKLVAKRRSPIPIPSL
ncbi:uncharacterized protein C8Q71DRAFT_846812 [Rhodofomes roseus]|uniref:Protein kinase domain-containing protein n=1 Tax=Rhodofomes roseus TaxID=34475 RepID=A0ABQ8KN17_9APHY|nr:uncharacterized protein C8Q71DRAFT_846812 [Rhodofomes roseus]KAH9839152.1 hypothetical protein C8Q71DRAFT_846812 [Rhodofomes roseus]